METVIVAAPDQQERRWLVKTLRGADYVVLEARDQAETLALIVKEPRALVVAAEETPPGPATQLVTALREATLAPIVVIGDERLMTRLEALTLGADYYDPRPVLKPLLISRVRSLFRRWGRQMGSRETEGR